MKLHVGSLVQFLMLIRMMYVSLASGVHGGRKTTAKICAWKSTWFNPFLDIIEGSWTEEQDTKCMWKPGRMLSYVVVGCSDRSGKRLGLSFHRFPKDPELHKRWIAAVCCENLPPHYLEGALVWPAHFEDGDFDRDIQAELMGLQRPKRLKRGAMLIVRGSVLFSGDRDSLFICWYNNCSLAQLVLCYLTVCATQKAQIVRHCQTTAQLDATLRPAGTVRSPVRSWPDQNRQ